MLFSATAKAGPAGRRETKINALTMAAIAMRASAASSQRTRARCFLSAWNFLGG